MPQGTGLCCWYYQCALANPGAPNSTLLSSTPAGRKNWVGVNEWQARPPARVALGVFKSEAVTAWVLERLTR